MVGWASMAGMVVVVVVVWGAGREGRRDYWSGAGWEIDVISYDTRGSVQSGCICELTMAISKWGNERAMSGLEVLHGYGHLPPPPGKRVFLLIHILLFGIASKRVSERNGADG